MSLTGIGVILGAGVYALIGPAAGLAGHLLWLAFVVAGSAAALTAYAYSRLVRLRAKNSAEFQYAALAFGPTVGFVAGWLMLAADLFATAAVALGFGGYLAHLLGTSPNANALVLLGLVGAVLYSGVGRSVRLAIILTIVEAAGLFFVILVGVPFWSGANLVDAPRGAAGVSSAAALIFFAYLGFDELANFVEEMRRPERDLPRALLISVASTTAIYVLVAVSVTATVGPARLSASEAPLALVARQALGPRADVALSFIALAATANTVLLLLASASRSVYGMAVAGVLPPRLARLGGASVPTTALALVLVSTAVLVVTGNLQAAATLTDAAVLISFIMVNLSLSWLAVRGASGAHGARRAADLLVPGLAVILCAWLLLHAGGTSVSLALGVAAIGALAAPRTREALAKLLRRA